MMKFKLIVLHFLLANIFSFNAQNIYPDDAYPNMNKEMKTFMEDGGWCWYEDPRAIINNGKLIIGAISGMSGDIRVGIYDLENDKNLGTVVLDKNFEIDDHNSPVFHARPDGSLVAMWAEHGHEKFHYYSISDPNDYLKWGERQVFDHGFEIPEGARWRGVTYMNLYTIEKQKLVYNFFRDGVTYNPTFITSSDDGSTWGNRNHLIMDEVGGRQRPYARYMQRNKNMVGISFTDGHPDTYGNSLYYTDFDGTSFYKADGTKIKDLTDGPLKTSEADKVFTGSETITKQEGNGSVLNSAWTCDLEKDKAGNPFIGYTLYKKENDIRFRLANWNGEKWVDREIAYAGPGLYPTQSSYTGLMALDNENPNNIFISSAVNPNTGKEQNKKHEIYFAEVDGENSTSNLKWKQLTFNSEYKNIRPITVHGEGYKVVLWLGGGPWRHFQSYESNILGYILEKPN